MKILVTGATGFIGQNVCRYIRENYPDIELLAPRRIELLEAVVTGPDIIIHLAGNPIVKAGATFLEAAEMFHANVTMTFELLTLAPKHSRFVYSSSSTVYGDGSSRKFEDDHVNPGSLYASTKLASEDFVLAFHNMGKVNGLILRYVANVGLGATHGLVLDILRKLRCDSDHLCLLGDKPGSRKPFVNVLDTARITVEMALAEYEGTFNVTCEDNCSVLDVANWVMMITGIKKTIEWEGEGSTWAGDQKILSVSNEKLNAIRGMQLEYQTPYRAIEKAVDDLWVR